MDDYVDALVIEIERKTEAKKNLAPFPSDILTLYFGGGTPTLLPVYSLKKILSAIYENYKVDSNAEITIEANPEQCSVEYLTDLKNLGFNRISIGIQSFNNNILQLLGRTHSEKDARSAVENAQKAGFENISVDLMYGICSRSPADWAHDLQTVFRLPVKHLSAYSLTIEENTLLHKNISQHKAFYINEEQSLQEMKLLMKEAKKNRFEQYEVSNFALKGYPSKHNSNYWNGTPYLGFGASAHSFSGATRSWNISPIEKYRKALQGDEPFFEIEHLTVENQYNEYVLVKLRTKEGVDLKYIEACFGIEKRNGFLRALQQIKPQYYEIHSDKVLITKKGLPLLDFITVSLISYDSE